MNELPDNDLHRTDLRGKHEFQCVPLPLPADAGGGQSRHDKHQKHKFQRCHKGVELEKIFIAHRAADLHLGDALVHV